MNTITPSRRRWFAWSTREILLIAAIGVVFGLLMAASLYAFAVTVAFGPVVGWAWIGFYLLPSFFVGYIMRRPASALLVAILYSLVMLLFSPYGPLILINCAFYAVSGELALLLGTRYRAFSLFWMIVSGIVGGAVMLVLFLIFYRDSLLGLATPVLIAVIITTLVSGAVSSVIARLLADAVARTGALSGTPLQQAAMPEV